MSFALPTVCPFARYYVCHAIIALCIAAALWWPLGINAGLAAGGAFYVGREFTQWESGLSFDWKGISAPIAAVLAAKTVWCLFSYMI